MHASRVQIAFALSIAASLISGTTAYDVTRIAAYSGIAAGDFYLDQCTPGTDNAAECAAVVVKVSGAVGGGNTMAARAACGAAFDAAGAGADHGTMNAAAAAAAATRARGVSAVASKAIARATVRACFRWIASHIKDGPYPPASAFAGAIQKAAEAKGVSAAAADAAVEAAAAAYAELQPASKAYERLAPREGSVECTKPDAVAWQEHTRCLRDSAAGKQQTVAWHTGRFYGTLNVPMGHSVRLKWCGTGKHGVARVPRELCPSRWANGLDGVALLGAPAHLGEYVFTCDDSQRQLADGSTGPVCSTLASQTGEDCENGMRIKLCCTPQRLDSVLR